MEEKKFDVNTIVGFLLIGGILLFMMWQNAPTQEEIDAENAEKAKLEKITEENNAVEEKSNQDISLTDATTELSVATQGDSLGLEKLQNRLGSFAYSGTLPSATDATTVIENEVLKLTVSNKGGYIVEAKLKQHTIYTGESVYLIKDGNSSLNLQFTSENRTLNSQELFFEPTLSNNGNNQVLSMKFKDFCK